MRTLSILMMGTLLSIQSSADDAKALFRPQELSEAPSAKSNWQLIRTAPDAVNGSTQLILVHGLSTDFWEPFTAWASDSDEAAEFRAQFQLWKYLTPNEGVNAAVGYSSAYAGFEESLAAYFNRFILAGQEDGIEGTDGEK